MPSGQFPVALTPGTRLGPYEIVASLGAGGMGAADLVATRGRNAFSALRDKTGPFVFMDTYVFVDSPDGVELVNPGQPSLEGRNMTGVTDLKGRKLVNEYIAAAMRDGSAWVRYYWYRPGSNTPAEKQTFVRKVQFGGETFIVGSGFYSDEESTTSEQ